VDKYARAATVGTSRVKIALYGGLLLLVLVPSFVSLGLWQWRKAEVRTQAQQQLDARSRAPAVALPAIRMDARQFEFNRVYVRGEFDVSRQVLIDNQVHNEVAGYHVITPLRIEGGPMHVLVNRGWIPAGASHSEIPVVATPAGTVEVSGVAVIPSQRFFNLAPQPTSGWAPVWQNLDLTRFRNSVAYPLQPVIVQLDPKSPAGFVRDWPRADERADKNLSYALQWFGFAAASVGIWLFFLLRRSQ
jgi:surfeit locus 1 family protein